MSINLIVNPEIGAMSWEEFCNTVPPYSASLDGFVNTGPCFNENKIIVNFNHHEGCDRLATRSTCAQILMAIRQGMFAKFRDHTGPKLNVYVNDCDEDVCTSWFLLKYHHLVDSAMNPSINRLVSMEDALDATAGAYPFPADLPALQELAWIFEPYRQFRLNGGLDKRDASSFRSVIVDVEHRIMHHMLGQGDKLSLDVRYDVIGGGNGWVMVKEIGAHARTGMFGNGIKAYVSVRVRNSEHHFHGDRWTYTLGKLSPFIPFDLLKLTEVFNKEDSTVTELDKWGGGNNIMGSPRIAGSALSPDELSQLIKDTLT